MFYGGVCNTFAISTTVVSKRKQTIKTHVSPSKMGTVFCCLDDRARDYVGQIPLSNALVVYVDKRTLTSGRRKSCHQSATVSSASMTAKGSRGVPFTFDAWTP